MSVSAYMRDMVATAPNLASTNFLVAVRSGEDVHKVAQRLSSLGMKVERELRSVGMVSGSADPRLKQAIEKLEGVEHVREEGHFHVPPFSGRVPQ